MLVAPLAFDKPTLRAAQVAGAIARGLERAGWEVDLCPLARGGAGTVEALLLGLGGETADGYALLEGGATAITEDVERVGDAAASGAEVVVVCAADSEGGPTLDGLPDLTQPTPRIVALAGPVTDAEAWRAAGATVVDGTSFVLDALNFQERMLSARALVLGQGTLERADLRSMLGEAATRARQSGVPAHAIVGANRIDLFDQRILDLQHVYEAQAPDDIADAAERLAGRL